MWLQGERFLRLSDFSIHATFLCRRCLTAKLLSEVLNVALPNHPGNYKCPDCGGVCDAYIREDGRKARWRGLRGNLKATQAVEVIPCTTKAQENLEIERWGV